MNFDRNHQLISLSLRYNISGEISLMKELMILKEFQERLGFDEDDLISILLDKNITILLNNREKCKKFWEGASYLELSNREELYSDYREKRGLERIDSSQEIKKEFETVCSFNIEKVKEKIEKIYSKIREAENKDIVLVLGNTGAGKSTLINRLLGCKMEPKKIKAKRTAHPLGPREDYYPRMGTGWKSETDHPEIYTKNFNYCDCPGFEDTREDEVKIINTIATQMVIEKSRSIKAIMVVIDWPSVESGVGQNFRDLGKTLGKMFGRKLDEAPFLFVVNKGEDITVEDFLAASDEIIKDSTNESTKLLERKTRSSNEDKRLSELHDILKILRLMNTNNVKIADIFDSTENNCQMIESSLSKINVKIEEFKFADDDMLSKFNIVMDDMLIDNLKRLKRLEGIYNESKEIDDEINQIEENISDLKEREISLDGEEIEDKVKDLEEKERILKAEENEITDEITKLLIERMELIENDSLIDYYKDSVSETRKGVFGVLGQTRKEFSYKGISFDEIVEDPPDSELFKERFVDAEHGEYRSVYTSHYGSDGVASITIRIKKNESPATKETISFIDRQVTEKSSERRKIIVNREEIAKEIVAVKKLSIQDNEEKRRLIHIKIEECEEKLKTIRKTRSYKVRSYNTIKKGCEILMEENQPIEITFDMTNVLKFNKGTEDLIKKFKELYNFVKERISDPSPKRKRARSSTGSKQHRVE